MNEKTVTTKKRKAPSREELRRRAKAKKQRQHLNFKKGDSPETRMLKTVSKFLNARGWDVLLAGPLQVEGSHPFEQLAEHKFRFVVQFMGSKPKDLKEPKDAIR